MKAVMIGAVFLIVSCFFTNVTCILFVKRHLKDIFSHPSSCECEKLTKTVPITVCTMLRKYPEVHY